MRVALVSDLHANRVAAEAVLADCPPVDAWVCAGDVVGYGPDPGFCVDAMRERDALSVLGNHERAVLGGADLGSGMAGAGVRHARRVLDGPQREWLSGLPTTRTAFDGRLRVVHGHPDDPDRYVYPALFSAGMLDGEDVLVTGHTHVQDAKRFDAGLVCNPGSVGQPRDGDPRAAYAALDLDGSSLDMRRVEYDVETAVAAVEAAGLPEGTGTRLRKGR
jgi:putative phosphoesterase